MKQSKQATFTRFFSGATFPAVSTVLVGWTEQLPISALCRALDSACTSLSTGDHCQATWRCVSWRDQSPHLALCLTCLLGVSQRFSQGFKREAARALATLLTQWRVLKGCMRSTSAQRRAWYQLSSAHGSRCENAADVSLAFTSNHHALTIAQTWKSESTVGVLHSLSTRHVS